MHRITAWYIGGRRPMPAPCPARRPGRGDRRGPAELGRRCRGGRRPQSSVNPTLRGMVFGGAPGSARPARRNEHGAHGYSQQGGSRPGCRDGWDCAERGCGPGRSRAGADGIHRQRRGRGRGRACSRFGSAGARSGSRDLQQGDKIRHDDRGGVPAARLDGPFATPEPGGPSSAPWRSPSASPPARWRRRPSTQGPSRPA